MILGPFHFHVNYRVSLSVCAKKQAEILIGILFTLETSLGDITVLKILSLLIHQQELSLFKF